MPVWVVPVRCGAVQCSSAVIRGPCSPVYRTLRCRQRGCRCCVSRLLLLIVQVHVGSGSIGNVEYPIPYLCACILLCNIVPCLPIPRHGPRVCTRWISWAWAYEKRKDATKKGSLPMIRYYTKVWCFFTKSSPTWCLLAASSYHFYYISALS